MSLGLLRRTPTATGRVLTAAGTRLDLADKQTLKKLRKYRQGWQDEAWSYNDAIGELRYAHDFIGHSVSRMRLFVGAYTDDPQAAPVPVDDAKIDSKIAEAAKAALDRLGTGKRAVASLLMCQAVNFQVAGECYLLGRINPETKLEEWSIRSIDEIVSTDRGYHLRELPTDFTEGNPLGDKPLDPDETYVARLWKPHPRFRVLADSPMRALLELCEELLILSRGVRAQAKSRLAGSGLLLVPDELTMAQAEESDDNITADPFLSLLTQAMTAPILDEASPSAVVPIVIRGPMAVLDSLKHIILEQKLDTTAFEARAELIRRIATGLDLPSAVLTGLEDANHWCADTETEILTDKGWVTQDRLDVGDTVLTINHESGSSEWQQVQNVYRAQVTDEPMLSMEGRFHSSLTTMNHRWPILRTMGSSAEDTRPAACIRCARPIEQKTTGRPRLYCSGSCKTSAGREGLATPITAPKARRGRRQVRAWATSAELRSSRTGAPDRLLTAAPHADAPSEPKWSDAFVELVGWIWTEGALRYRAGRLRPTVHIYQSHQANPDYVSRIRAALTSLFGPPTDGPMGTGGRAGPGVGVCDGVPRWREIQRAGRTEGMTVFSLNAVASAPFCRVAPDRVVDRGWVRELTAAQLELFITTSIRADGSVMSGGTRYIIQADPVRLEAFELAAILAGYSTNSYTSDTLGFDRHTQHIISIRENASFGPKDGNKSEVKYTGVVWCPTTANGSWYARRHGKVFITGNSAWAIDDSTFRQHLEPAVLVMIDSLTQGYLWPALAAVGFTPDQYRQVVIWYDPTELVTHPDRTADALQMWDRFAISDEALRQATGFAESDAPEGIERVTRLVSHARTFPPNVLESIVHRLDPSLEIVADLAEPGEEPDGPTPIAGPAAPPAGAPGQEQKGQPAEGPPAVGRGGGPAAVSGAPARGAHRAITAGSPRPPRGVKLDRLGGRLTQMDYGLMSALHASSTAAVRRNLERAGARARSALQGNPTVVTALKGVDNVFVCQTLGHALASTALSGHEPDFAELQREFEDQVGRVQAHTLALARAAVAETCDQAEATEDDDALTECDFDEGELAEMAATQQRHRHAAWLWLLAALHRVVAARTVGAPPSGKPRPGPPGAQGDANLAGNLVPLGLVRAALAIAGGFGSGESSPGLGPDGRPVDRSEPFGGAGVGPDLLGMLASRNIVVAAWEWVHDDPQVDFQPHLALDGIVGASIGDPAFGGFYIGDHAGCRCFMQPSMVVDSGTGEILNEAA